MRRIMLRWLVIFASVLVAATFFPGYVSYQDWASVAVFAAVLALLNVFVKPILALVTLPISCLTLGLFVVVINAFLFWLAGELTGGRVEVNGALGALLGSLIVSFVSVLAARVK